MNPEEIAKQCAEAIVQGKSTYKRDYRALIVEKLTPILTAHLAAREEELDADEQVVERDEERAFCVIILRLLGIDETDEQIQRIGAPVHELFRSRRAWRDLAKSLTREKHHLAAREEEYARLREAAAEALDLLEKTWTGDYQKPNIVRRLRERLTPQQEPGK